MAWASPIFSGLTSLKISCPSAPQQDATAFIDALERMPNLETLDLKVPLPVFVTGTVARIVPMACIKKLTVNAPLECAGALQHMTLPESAHLKLDLTDGGNEDSAVAAFVSTLTSSWLSAPLSTAKDWLDICSIRIDNNRICGWFSFADFSDFDNPELSIGFDKDESQDNLASKLISSLPLTKLREVTIFGAPDERAISSLSRVPSIEMVTTGGRIAPPVLNFMNDDPAFKETETTPVTRFPGLQVLESMESDFCGDVDDAIRLDVLLDLLVSRRESGGEIQKIEFSCCDNFSEANFNQVRKVVPEAVWDEWGLDDIPQVDASLGPLMFAFWMASRH